MNKPTEKGLIISAIGFLSQAIFMVLAVINGQYACCLVNMIGLFGLILIYIGRFDHAKKQQDMAKYAILLYILTFIGILIFNYTSPTVFGVTVSSGIELGMLMVVSMMMIYALTTPSQKHILHLAVVAGIIGAAGFSYLTYPINLDNADMRVRLEDIRGRKETESALVSPLDYRDDVDDELVAINNSISAMYETLDQNFSVWEVAINITDTGKLIDSGKEGVLDTPPDLNSVLELLNATLSNSSLSLAQLNLTEDMQNLTLNTKKKIAENITLILENEDVISLLEGFLENGKKYNERSLAKVPAYFLFALAYWFCYKRVKAINDAKDEKRKLEMERIEAEAEKEHKEALREKRLGGSATKKVSPLDRSTGKAKTKKAKTKKAKAKKAKAKKAKTKKGEAKTPVPDENVELDNYNKAMDEDIDEILNLGDIERKYQ